MTTTPKTKGKNYWYIPCTPAGTLLIYGAAALMGKPLASKFKEEAIRRLLRDAAHMPYKNWKEFQERGYTILKQSMPERWKP